MINITLEVIQGPDKGIAATAREPESLIIGRSSEANLKIDSSKDGQISRKHCIVEFLSGQYMLTDLNSRNGTFLNGQKIQRCFLQNGDKIKAGNTAIAVTIDEETSSQKGSKGFACADCGMDLSARAHLDGLANDLGESLYLCPQCTEKQTKQRFSFLDDDRYLVLEEIGKGGMGIVYKTVHRLTGRICALKRIHPASFDDPRRIKQFEREITVQSKVLHPNLVRILDKGITDSTCYFITEYLPGGDVDKLIKNVLKKPLPPPFACAIITQILKGLAALHKEGFIHRDLKPSNFLLSRPKKDNSCHAKICDYGLAKSFETTNSLFDITKTKGGLEGSVMFMSPEIIKNYKYGKPPVDVYSVGVSLYFMLSGQYTLNFLCSSDNDQSPFLTGRQRHPVKIVLEDEPIPLLKRNPHIPSCLAAVVDKAVAKDPEEGYASADELRTEIERIMKTEGWK